tara:strand:+ start:526 stop:630 length:105 start_codon:yes stop_codon:yes gene_type:complete
MRAGEMPPAEANGTSYIKLQVDIFRRRRWQGRRT